MRKPSALPTLQLPEWPGPQKAAMAIPTIIDSITKIRTKNINF
jgi:hypothetical protein